MEWELVIFSLLKSHFDSALFLIPKSPNFNIHSEQIMKEDSLNQEDV